MKHDNVASIALFDCDILQISCFFFFYSRAAVSVVFPTRYPVQVLSFARCCASFIVLSEQIKMTRYYFKQVYRRRYVSRRSPNPKIH